MKRLENKAVVITGVAGGIGKATAQKMIKEGAKVLISDLDKDALKKVSTGFPTGEEFHIR